MLAFSFTSLLYFCTLWTAGLSLECYSCKSSKIVSKSGSSSWLQNLVGSVQEDRACDEASLTDMGNIPTTRCGSDNVCGDVRASITIGEGFTNSEITLETVGRGCMPRQSDSGTVFGGHCEAGANAVKGATNVLLAILNDLPLVDIKVDGEVCYCETDLCSAGRCADDSFKIGDYCIKIWYVAVPAGIILILLISCCVCCCCGCFGCCQKTPRPYIIHQSFQPVNQGGQPPYVRFDGNDATTMGTMA